jgi:class 3 adenylate cyclase
MDVVVWLRSLGLEKYEVAFRDNEIDERVLPSITQEDLKEIGVGPVGHRRMLLEAIAALREDTGSNVSSADVAATSSVPNVSPQDRAERRHVTVMFSDLVGSTELSTRMDPEDLREVISAYQNSVAETVGRFGGFVAKYMGDGVLAYFGYPQAHEHDAENDRLAIDDELRLAVFERSFDNPRIALRPVEAVAGNQPHAIAAALDAQPITVILDLVEPVRGRWNFGAASGDTKIKRL